MDSKSVLKMLINLLYYLSIGVGLVFIIVTLYVFINNDGTGLLVKDSIVIDSNFQTNLKKADIGKLIFVNIQIATFILVLYHLRNAALTMIEGKVFVQSVVRHLRWTGYFLIVYVVVDLIGVFIINLMYKSQVQLVLEFVGIGTNFFVIVLGLFFILLSHVFTHGHRLSEENQLTI